MKAGILAISLVFLAAGCSRGGSMQALLEGRLVPLTVRGDELGPEYKAVSISAEGHDLMGFYTSPMMWFAMSGSNTPEEDLIVRLGAVWTKGEKVSVDGKEYYITYAIDISREMNELKEGKLPETLSLRLYRLDHVKGMTPMGDLRPTADEEVATGSPRERARQTESVSNLRHLAQAMHIYLADWDDVFPYAQDTASVFGVLRPYVVDLDKMNSPNADAQYTFNMNLAGVNAVSLTAPPDTPLFYETAPWPDGSRAVAFADTHTRLVTSDEWPAIQRALETTYPKAPGAKPLPPGHGHGALPGELRAPIRR